MMMCVKKDLQAAGVRGEEWEEGKEGGGGLQGAPEGPGHGLAANLGNKIVCIVRQIYITHTIGCLAGAAAAYLASSLFMVKLVPFVKSVVPQ